MRNVTYKNWTPADRRAARAAGYLPPAPPPPEVDQLRPLTPAAPAPVTVPLYGDDRANRDAQRRRAADDVLAKHGVRPHDTW